MSCQECEGILIELSRGGLEDARASAAVLAHAQACTRCGALLAEQTRLTAELRNAAAGREDVQAPPLIEARLIEAFRERAHTARYRPNQYRWLAVTAAAVFVATVSGATWWSLTRKQETRPEPVPAAVALPIAPEAPRAVAAPPVVRHSVARRPRAVAPRREIATEFFPLVDPESLRALDGGQIMRVRLPRSLLFSFGLPVNEDRALERIQADVLVGNDGIARAVRFVR